MVEWRLWLLLGAGSLHWKVGFFKLTIAAVDGLPVVISQAASLVGDYYASLLNYIHPLMRSSREVVIEFAAINTELILFRSY